MKKFLIYTVVAALATFLATLAAGLSFWAVFILAEIGCLILVLGQGNPPNPPSHPRLAKWLGVALTAYVVFLAGGFWFTGIFPVTKGVLSRTILRRDAQAALRANDGLGPVSGVIADNLIKEGDKLAARVSSLITNGSPQDVTNALGSFKSRWSTIKSGLEPTLAPKPAPTSSSASAKPKFEAMPTGTHLIRVAPKEETNWKVIPKDLYWSLSARNDGGDWQLKPFDGHSVQYKKGQSQLTDITGLGNTIKLINDGGEELEFDLVVKSR